MNLKHLIPMTSPQPVERLRRSARIAPAAIVLGAGMIARSASAQTIDTMTQNATQHGMTAFSYGLNAFCFVVGGFLILMAFLSWYQHQKNPNAAMRPGAMVAAGIVGGIMLAFPFMAGTVTRTVTGQNVTATGAQNQMQFTQ